MAKTALLVQDLQNGIIGRVVDPSLQDEYLKRASTTINAARKAGVQIIYVKVSFRPGHPEIHPGNLMFAPIAGMGAFVDGDAASTISDAVKPVDGDIVVTKKRVSSFAGTDLELVLRSLGIRDIALAGIATSGVILSTLRHAADHDYAITVLEDICADSDPEVHSVLMGKVFPVQAKVEKAQEWLSKLG